MKKNYLIIRTLTVFLVCLGLVAGSLWAQEAQDKDEDVFSGSFLVGYRLVDVDGVESKYMEDINLDSGARLFNFNLHYAPAGKMKNLLDYMDLRVYNFGGDPFESLSIDVVKWGKYQLKYDRRKSTYFYNDILEGHDYHTFSFDRVRDSGSLKLWVGNKAHLFLDFDRYTKKGDSVTTFDMGRCEFEFDKPIDEESAEVAIGFDYATKGFSLLVEERILDYENANSMFLPGYADGGTNARYPTSLNYFHLNQPYDMKGYTHMVKFTAKPFKNLWMAGSVQSMKQDTDITYMEDAWGVDYLGADVMYANGGAGDFTRKMQLYDFNFSYFLSSKMALVGATHYNNFEQTGSLTVNGDTTPVDIKYETGGVEAGIQYQFSTKFGLTVGYRFERRDVEDEVEIESENAPTDRTGIYGNIKWNLSKAFKLTFDYQNGTYDNPVTLISPTDFNRFRLTLKYQKKKVYINGSYLFNKSKSDENGAMWESNKNKLNLRFGYHAEKVKFFAGYSLIDVSREGDRTIFYPPAWSGGSGSYSWDILFEGKSHLFDIYLYNSFNKSWGLGAYFNQYKNNGSWELSRTTLNVFLKYMFDNGLIGQLGYRLVDFKEKEFGYNDYKANIFEISFGYKWK